MRLLLIIFISTVLSGCNGYRILGMFPFHGKSHFIMFEQIMKALAVKGHQVDVVSSFPLKKPFKNYNDIVSLPVEKHFMNNMTYQEMNSLIADPLLGRTIAAVLGNPTCEHLGNPGIQKLLKNPPTDPPYDLVLIEIFGANCYAVFGHVLKVPVIGVSSSALYPWAHEYIANPENLAFMPNNFLSFSQRMTFWQRLYNYLHTEFNKWVFRHDSAEQTDIMRKYVGPDVPDIRELEKSMSLILTNSYMSLNGIKESTPALIEVGGLHVQEEGVELSPSLEKWMNESKNGFIYFTFGSMVKIESFPSKYLNIFYNSLGKIAPIRVLMKIAKPEELPPGLPKNVHVLPWIPQIKVLKHPNVKAFITHGGLMGTQEAIHYGVPLIGIPLFADQFININIYVQKGLAIGLNLDTLTEEKMDEALNTVLTDPKYRERAKKVSELFLDRPLSAADTAVYWIEYVIRHGADALRSPAMDLTWWQRQLLDVYAFLLIVALVSMYLLIATLRFLFRLVSLSEPSHKKKVS